MSTGDLGDGELTELLQRYLTILQDHPSAEEMMDRILTRDFQTGFVGGHLWRGLDGLRDFLSQREGFCDESHVIDELLGRSDADGVIEAHTRLHFFHRRWESPSPTSEEFPACASTRLRTRASTADCRPRTALYPSSRRAALARGA
jgi:hypothetical protein